MKTNSNQRTQAMNQRIKNAGGLVTIVRLDKDSVAALERFMKLKSLTRNQAINQIVRLAEG